MFRGLREQETSSGTGQTGCWVQHLALELPFPAAGVSLYQNPRARSNVNHEKHNSRTYLCLSLRRTACDSLYSCVFPSAVELLQMKSQSMFVLNMKFSGFDSVLMES